MIFQEGQQIVPSSYAYAAAVNPLQDPVSMNAAAAYPSSFRPGGGDQFTATTIRQVATSTNASTIRQVATNTNASLGQNENVYPERPGEQECQYYMRRGECKYGARCKFHHPARDQSTK